MLSQLRSGNAEEAWKLFISEYAALIFQVVQHFETDSDNVSDCFQFICERLCEYQFRRLVKFKTDGAASFSTWLRAVVRNLCLDWQRKQFGRRRMFRSVARLSDLDQQIFRLVYERGVSEQEVLLSLAPNFPELTPELVSEAIQRVNKTLTKNQNWLVRARAAFPARRSHSFSEMQQHEDPVAPQANPETLAIEKERATLLKRALRGLSTVDKLMVRLRFEEELTLEQIAKLLNLGNAQRVDRQIKQILSTLRAELSVADAVERAGKIQLRP